jgi:iron complex outermembrane receptor protein
MSAVTSGGKAYTTDGLNSDRIPGTERHLISLSTPMPTFSARIW